MKLNRLFSLILIFAFVLPNVACGAVVDTAKQGIAERDQLVALAQGVQSAASNFNLVVDTQYAKIKTSNTIFATYLTSVNLDTQAWTGHYQDQQATLDKTLKDATTNNVGGDPSKPNLADLAAKNALPNSTGLALQLYATSVVQAAPPVPDAKVALAMMDTANEAMNTIQLAGTDWNDAVRKYNTLRSSVSGEVVTAASKIIGFPLPSNFPYYQGGNNGQPVTDPLAAPTVAK